LASRFPYFGQQRLLGFGRGGPRFLPPRRLTPAGLRGCAARASAFFTIHSRCSFQRGADQPLPARGAAAADATETAPSHSPERATRHVDNLRIAPGGIPAQRGRCWVAEIFSAAPCPTTTAMECLKRRDRSALLRMMRSFAIGRFGLPGSATRSKQLTEQALLGRAGNRPVETPTVRGRADRRPFILFQRIRHSRPTTQNATSMYRTPFAPQSIALLHVPCLLDATRKITCSATVVGFRQSTERDWPWRPTVPSRPGGGGPVRPSAPPPLRV